MLNLVLAQINQQPGKSDFTYPYDSSAGIPEPYFWTAAVILAYLALRFYLSLKKDKKTVPASSKKEKKIKNKKKWRPPINNNSAS